MVNREELISAIAERVGCHKYEAKIFLDGFNDVMKEYLIAGETVNIRNFFKVGVKEYEGRTGRCPCTGESVEIPPLKKVRFTVSKVLNKAINEK